MSTLVPRVMAKLEENESKRKFLRTLIDQFDRQCRALGFVISCEPSGPFRNELTEMHIHLLAADEKAVDMLKKLA